MFLGDDVCVLGWFWGCGWLAWGLVAACFVVDSRVQTKNGVNKNPLDI